jgi:hypothetical protein
MEKATGPSILREEEVHNTRCEGIWSYWRLCFARSAATITFLLLNLTTAIGQTDV